MKVKILANINTETLENSVNDFLQEIANKTVIDIKYACSDQYSECMIIYDEKEAAE